MKFSLCVFFDREYGGGLFLSIVLLFLTGLFPKFTHIGHEIDK